MLINIPLNVKELNCKNNPRPNIRCVGMSMFEMFSLKNPKRHIQILNCRVSLTLALIVLKGNFQSELEYHDRCFAVTLQVSKPLIVGSVLFTFNVGTLIITLSYVEVDFLTRY